jgi:hypothetical protein
MKAKIFLTFALFIVASTISSANNFESCVAQNNISCDYCLALGFEIIPTEIKDSFVVNDHASYKIELTNVGSSSINDNFTITIYNPENKVQHNRTYRGISINPKSNFTLIPNQTGKMFDIFPFEVSGPYQMTIKSDKTIIYYIFYPSCGFVSYTNSYTNYFDIMPRWQYDTNTKTESLAEASKNLTEESKNLTLETRNLTKDIENYTIALIVLTLLLILIELRTSIKKYRWQIIAIKSLVILALGFGLLLEQAVTVQSISIWVLIIVAFLLLTFIFIRKYPRWRVSKLAPRLVIAILLYLILCFSFILDIIIIVALFDSLKTAATAFALSTTLLLILFGILLFVNVEIYITDLVLEKKKKEKKS